MIPKTAIKYFKREKNKHTEPYRPFYDAAILALEKDELMTMLRKNKVFVKILHMDDGDFWIVFTDIIEYEPKIPNAQREYLEEEEMDVIAEDIEEAVSNICALMERKRRLS